MVKPYAESFSLERITQRIIETSEESGITLLEAACSLAAEMDWEPHALAPYITGTLKDMIKIESEASGMLRRDNNPSFSFE